MYKLILIDGTKIDIDRAAVNKLIHAESDNYRLFGDNIVQRPKKINPFQLMPNVKNPDREWWLEPILKSAG